METQTNHNLIWKISVPIAAIVLVIGIIVYTGGYGNFLKLLGIKASEQQTFVLNTQDQFLGNRVQGSLIVPGSIPTMNGVVVVNASNLVPVEPGPIEEQGLVMSLYDAEDPTANSYPEHIYTSPTLDLGSPNPILSSIAVSYHLPTGATLAHSYRTAESLVALMDAAFVPLEFAEDANSSEITTATLVMESAVKQFVQVKVEILNDSFANRTAIYSWSFQYDQNLTPLSDENTDFNFEDMPTNINIVPITLDLTATENLPETINVQVLTATTIGSQEVVSYIDLATAEIAPLYNLPMSLPTGHYALVMRGIGIEAHVIAFEVSGETPMTITVSNMIKTAGLETTFDLNGDGAVNTLDLSILIQHYGLETSSALDNN